MGSMRAKAKKPCSKKGKRYVQSRLQIGSQNSSHVKCPKCEMTYSTACIDDVNTHMVYHDMQLKGRRWSSNWGAEVRSSIKERYPMMTPPSSSSKSFNSSCERIVMIRPDFIPEVNATLEMLNLVNDELNAPHDENDFWSQPQGQGKAFLFIKNNRAIGVVTMEVLDPVRGRWMVYDTKCVLDHVRPNFILGVSRIWVCRHERCSGVATKLLEAARENTIYGKALEKWEIAWSQPTDSGGKLASKYNGREHKSGKLLLPCYI